MFHSYRQTQLAAALKKCASCGQPLPVSLDKAQPVASLCDNCAHPVRLGGVRAPVARDVARS